MQPTPSTGARRRDIQGLRAVAVMLVAAYHSGLPLDGGFVGVDVFFVISGFVITRSLLDELGATATISLRTFYVRRARRLLPALGAMIAIVLIVTALTTNPYDAQPFYVQTAVAAQAFVSNLFLYRHVGYFDVTAAQNPFLHMWSLSVEEQFYLVFPWLLLAASGGRRSRRTSIVLGAFLVVSLGLAILLTTDLVSLGLAVPERFAYFAAPTRAWEFLAGALLASTWERVEAHAARRATPLALVGLVVGALGVLTSGYPGQSPSGIPVLAVIGTVLIIAAGAGANPVGHVLSFRPLVVLGDWSYAWYLWHWPMIVFAATQWPAQRWLLPVAACLALVPAAASTILVERPAQLRSRETAHVGTRVLASVVVTALVSGCAWFGARAGWGVEVPTGWYDFPDGRQHGCTLFNRDIANTWPEDDCTTAGPPGSGVVLILGDETADGASPGVIEAAEQLGLGTALWDRVDCPFAGRTPVDYPACDQWNRDALGLVERLQPRVVVIANDGSDYVEAASANPLADGDGGPVDGRPAALRSWRAGIDETLDELRRLGVPVVLIAAPPDYGHAFPRSRTSVVRPEVAVPSLSRESAAARTRSVTDVEMAAVASHDRTAFVDPLDALCSEICRPEHNGEWWYHDAQLLTKTGSRRLAPAIESAMLDVLELPEGG